MKPNSCLGCPYYDKPGPRWGEGSANARIAFVSAEPMTPGEQRILDGSTRRAQVNRYSEFTTSLVKCSAGPWVDYKAIAKCRPLLDAELNNMPNLKVVVPLGDEPTKELMGKKLVSATSRTNPDAWMRGSVMPIGQRSYIPTQAPKFHMATGFTLAYQLDLDLEKVARFANGRGQLYENKRTNYNPTSTEVQEYCRELIACGRGGIDIETPTVKGESEEDLTAGGQALPIDVIGVSAHIGEAVGVPPDLYPLLEELFASPKPVKWYVFNAAFDFYHIGKTFASCKGVKIFDAMLALNRWRSDLQKKDLGTLLSFFTDMPYTKNLAGVDDVTYQWGDVTGVLEGGMNIERTLEIQGILQVLMQNDHPLLQDLVDPTYDGLSSMREFGVRTDIKEVFRFLQISKLTLEKYETTWNKLYPFINWNSSQQLLELFTGVFKLPVVMKTRISKKNGERTTKKTPCCDVDVLEKYRDEHGNKVAGLVLAMRTIKHLGDFAGIIRPDTSRIHTAYMIHRQVQFRIQAKDPNLQTLPEELAGYKTRRMVIPDHPDDMLIAIDASQIELRIYAWICQALGLLEAMRSDIYIYGHMYEQIYKKPFFRPGEPKTKYARESYVTVQELLAAKSGPLGFIYNRGSDSLVAKLGMAPTAAKAVHAGFHLENPEIQKFHRQCDREVERLGYQTNLWGARRYFPTPKIQKNEYYSFHGQSNGSELLKQQYLGPAFKYLKTMNNSRVLLTVHDSIVVNCKNGAKDKATLLQTAQFLYNQAEAPIPQMDGFSIPAEVKYGHNWSDMQLFKTERRNGRTVVLDVAS